MKAIVIVGSARSGTKMLGNVFSIHNGTTYFGEVNPIWKTGNETIKHDAIPYDEKVIPLIKKKFKEKTIDGTVIVEKTAANCLRLPLVTKVFDDLKIVHIVRDGRDVALSASQKWRGQDSKFEKDSLNYGSKSSIQKRILKRVILRLNEMSIKEVFSLFPKGINMLFTFLGTRNESCWGPIVPGLKNIRNTHSLIETCAYQWRVSEESVLNFLEGHKEIPSYTLKYEDICVNSRVQLKKILDFCELEIPDNFDQMVDSIKNGNLEKWKTELSIEDIKLIQDMSSFLLKYYGYELT